jgi:hypothetical protein
MARPAAGKREAYKGLFDSGGIVVDDGLGLVRLDEMAAAGHDHLLAAARFLRQFVVQLLPGAPGFPFLGRVAFGLSPRQDDERDVAERPFCQRPPGVADLGKARLSGQSFVVDGGDPGAAEASRPRHGAESDWQQLRRAFAQGHPQQAQQPEAGAEAKQAQRADE